MIEIGIDEATLVLSPPYEDFLDSDEFDCWSDVASSFVTEAAERLALPSVFGPERKATCCPAGYDVGYTYGQHDFYFAIAYNCDRPSMGVVVKFSAQALAQYTASTRCEFWEVLQRIQSPDVYRVRPSRVDATADFKDEGLSVDDIYKRLDAGGLNVFRKQHDGKGGYQLRRSSSVINGYFTGEEVETIYLGSKKKNTKMLLRIYNKRTEQIANHGTREKEARRLKDWVRFEISARHDYAHQFGAALLACRSDDDFAGCICQLFDDRYLFKESDGSLAPWSAALAAYADEDSGLMLSSPSRRKLDLAGSAAYIVNGSGLMPLLFKSEQIWGDGAPGAVLDWLRKEYSRYVPNDDARAWTALHRDTYRDEFLTVVDWLKEATQLLRDLES